MTGFDNILVRKNALSLDEIQLIFNSNLKFKKGRVGNTQEGALIKNRRVWQSDVHLDVLVTEKILNLFTEASKEFKIDFDPSLIFTYLMKYDSADCGYFDWHRDTDTGTEYAISNTIQRTLSMSLLLNEEYEGGDLCFEPKRFTHIKPGTAIVFPSTSRHCVKPITEGIRYSLVSWACVPR